MTTTKTLKHKFAAYIYVSRLIKGENIDIKEYKKHTKGLDMDLFDAWVEIQFRNFERWKDHK